MRRNTRKLGQNCHSALNNISKVHKDENSLPMEDVFLDDAIAYALGNWHPSDLGKDWNCAFHKRMASIVVKNSLYSGEEKNVKVVTYADEWQLFWKLAIQQDLVTLALRRPSRGQLSNTSGKGLDSDVRELVSSYSHALCNTIRTKYNILITM